MPAVCSLAVVINHGSRNHVATYIVNLGTRFACTVVLAYDAEALPCSTQEESCTAGKCYLPAVERLPSPRCAAHSRNRASGFDVPQSPLEL